MKKIIIILLLLGFCFGNEWPVLRHYDLEHTSKIKLPIGGIGTGTVSLTGRGELRDWEIMNQPAKGFVGTREGNDAPFFAIFTKSGNKAVSKGLMGPIEYFEYESMEGRGKNNHGLPRFRKCSFDAAYPFGVVNLSDPNIEVDVKIKGFNPLIPGDEEASGLPVAVLRYEVKNKSDKPMEVSVCGSMENFIGKDGRSYERDWKWDIIPTGAKNNKNEFHKSENLQGIFMYSDGVDKTAEQWGTMALTTPDDGDVTYRTSVSRGGWGGGLLDFWDDFSVDGVLTEKEFTGGDSPRASLALKKTLKAGESKEFTFYLTWHFPNRIAWASKTVGNYYTTLYKDAWDAAEKIAPQIKPLETKTIDFVNAFCESDLPLEVKEAALFNLSTLRSQTCFRTEDGRFYGWEGVMDMTGSCMGSCTHVWNYELATHFVFGNLAKMMREVEFNHATLENGLMSFRVGLPLETDATNWKIAAADGQMGTIMKMYNDWQLSGDDEMLKNLWPKVKKALSFAWIEGGWDGDIDGVMEGCQHNTMDVEYFGPNPQMQFWYLGALRAAGEMAEYLGDDRFAKQCKALFAQGSKWTEENLFNGEYFKHIIQTVKSSGEIADGLMAGMGADDLSNPDFQLGNGCLIDQLVGQYMAHICGLGYLGNKEQITKSLQSIMKYNYRSSAYEHFNNMRSYFLGDEAALLMASYPYDRPESPFSYFSEAMTGFEYTAAIGMLYEGMTEEGLKCIKNIRDRYDGKKRSPFNEAECGNHYSRAMASWAGIIALTGFEYSAVENSMMFDPIKGNHFWSTGYAYGTAEFSGKGKKKIVTIDVLGGEINLKTFALREFGKTELKKNLKMQEGDSKTFTVKNNDKTIGKRTLPAFDESIKIIQTPIIKTQKYGIQKSVSFSDKIEVEISAEAKIYYTTDGSEPTGKSEKYTKPIILDKSTVVKAIAIDGEDQSFHTSMARFYKITGYKNVDLKNQPSAKYSGKGAQSLCDGERGGSNYGNSAWLGFEEEDLDVILKLEKSKKISKVIVGILEAERSWIFLPKNIDVAISNDGKKFTKVKSLNSDDIKKIYNSNSKDLELNFDSAKTSFIKINIQNLGKCPEGHAGAGGKAWLFVDELVVE